MQTSVLHQPVRPFLCFFIILAVTVVCLGSTFKPMLSFTSAQKQTMKHKPVATIQCHYLPIQYVKNDWNINLFKAFCARISLGKESVHGYWCVL